MTKTKSIIAIAALLLPPIANADVLFKQERNGSFTVIAKEPCPFDSRYGKAAIVYSNDTAKLGCWSYQSKRLVVAWEDKTSNVYLPSEFRLMDTKAGK